MQKYALSLILTLFFVNDGLSQTDKSSSTTTLFKKARSETDFQKSIVIYESALENAEKYKQDELYSKIAVDYALKINDNQNFYKVGELLYKALSKAEKTANNSVAAKIHLLLSRNYYNLENFKLSDDHIDAATELYLASEDSLGLLKCTVNKGNNLLERKKNKEAIKVYQSALQMAREQKTLLYEGSMLSNIGMAYEQEGLLDSALAYAKKCVEIIPNGNPEFADLIMGNMIETSHIYFLKNDYDNAVKIGREAKSLSGKNLDFKMYAHRVLYRGYLGQKDYQRALEEFTSYVSIRDSLKQSSKNSQIENIRAVYENDKKSTELKLLNSEMETQAYLRNFLLIALLLFASIIALVVYSRRQAIRQKNAIKDANVRIEGLNRTLEQRVVARTLDLSYANTELLRKNEEISEALFKGQSFERERISSELHDNLGGMISSISWRLQAINPQNLSEKEKKIFQGIREMTKSAYADVRSLSHNLLPKNFKEKGLTGSVQTLINDLNDADGIKFDFLFDEYRGHKDEGVELNVYAIFMELINNILKHSMAKSAVITLRTNKDGSHEIIAEDDGVGINEATGGIPEFRSLTKRVELIEGKLEVLESLRGMKIRINL